MGFRAPAVAPELFGAALTLGAWALLAGGALGLHGPVGLRPHRRGLLVLAAGLVVLPLASGRVRHAELDVPCLVAAAVLVRIGAVRWAGLEEPDRGPAPDRPTALVVRDGSPVTAVKAASLARAGDAPARVAGRLTGRAGSVLGREAASALPRAARAAGRALGRARHQPPQR